MVFPSDGRNHYLGIQNEKDIVEHHNINRENPINSRITSDCGEEISHWKHEGGTRTKSDCVVETVGGIQYGVSIKNHSGGSFDWLNTSKIEPEILHPLREEIETYKAKYHNVSENTTLSHVSREMRDELDTILDKYIDMFSGKLTNMMSELYEKYPKWILINDKSQHKMFFFDKTNLHKYMNDGLVYLCKKIRAKSSRQIFIQQSDGTMKNTGLRIRLVLNNGVNALFGLSKTNNTSVPCIKIQQDQVKKFIHDCENKTEYIYT